VRQGPGLASEFHQDLNSTDAVLKGRPGDSMGVEDDFPFYRPGRPATLLPDEAADVLAALTPAFAAPTGRRFALPLAAAILTTRRRAVADLPRTAASSAPGHRTSRQRGLPAASWPGLRPACPLTRSPALRRLPADPIVLAGGATAGGHKGKKVYGKARHRGPARSGRSYTARRYGPQWVARAALVRSPLATRPGALPTPVDRYRPAERDRRRRRSHRTPAQLVRRLLRLALRWPPGAASSSSATPATARARWRASRTAAGRA
jgi:hypothetical protein